MDEVFGTTRQTSRSDLIWAAVVGLGAAVTFTGAQAFPENPPCPTKQLAPFGLAPVPNQCATADCLVLFKGYKWWTSYTYNNVEYFKNNGLGLISLPTMFFSTLVKNWFSKQTTTSTWAGTISHGPAPKQY